MRVLGDRLPQESPEGFKKRDSGREFSSELLEKVRKSVIFHEFDRGRVGGRSKDINIYTFWIDLDVSCPNFPKHSLVSRVPEAKIQKYSSRPNPQLSTENAYFRAR